MREGYSTRSGLSSLGTICRVVLSRVAATPHRPSWISSFSTSSGATHHLHPPTYVFTCSRGRVYQNRPLRIQRLKTLVSISARENEQGIPLLSSQPALIIANHFCSRGASRRSTRFSRSLRGRKIVRHVLLINGIALREHRSIATVIFRNNRSRLNILINPYDSRLYIWIAYVKIKNEFIRYFYIYLKTSR